MILQTETSAQNFNKLRVSVSSSTLVYKMDNKMSKLAPIILFTYNRIDCLKKTVVALQSNTLAKESQLLIYSDGPKSDASADDLAKIRIVREYLKSITGFREIHLYENQKNIGLGNNIIHGVTETVNKFGKAIILEDDIETSPVFLEYMNSALNYYQDKKEVWNISGWIFPAAEFKDFAGKSFLSDYTSSWSWATWQDRWNHFERNPDKLISSFPPKMVNKLNLNGKLDIWKQVIANKNGSINTWAIFWIAIITMNQGVCLFPYNSYARHIGFGDDATNCTHGFIDFHKNVELCTFKDFKFPDKLLVNKHADEIYTESRKNLFPPRYIRAINRLARKILKRYIFITIIDSDRNIKFKFKPFI